jgi:hypothetical protein
MPDGVRRREAPVEVHALDDRVGGEHLKAVALGLHDGRVVSDADDDPFGSWRESGLDPRDELGFGEV